MREHHRGRQLAELREDPFVRNRLSEADVSRLLEHPELVYALADDIVALRGLIAGAGGLTGHASFLARTG
jgi:hypothetical protein